MDINQVTLPCTDYAASVEFYRRLGLTQIVDSPPRYARFETPGGATLSIHAADAAGPGTIIYFEVDDVDAAVAAMQGRGLEFDILPVDQEWLWREAYLSDPAGNRLCIYHAGENRRFPPWRMTTTET
jgi:hydroxymethylpyrimidine/phosphomethylpyrimidine kinase